MAKFAKNKKEKVEEVVVEEAVVETPVVAEPEVAPVVEKAVKVASKPQTLASFLY